MKRSFNPVATGVDVLRAEHFKQLAGARVGLITNHTGLTREGEATVDIFHAAHQIHLKALFSPEHGIRGEMDENVSDSQDARTGLPVFSLYGARTRPTSEQLHGLDALVFDIQDIGTRFYTYISTLGLAMEEAMRRHIRFLVLDRPNPIGGVSLEGPLPDPDKLSFTAYHRIPIRHGLTVGELARLFHSERGLPGAVEIVPVQGWRRDGYWDTTGLTWINPSPNMRSAHQALLYPGIGLLESTNISVGRGTDSPFEVVGAPWMNGRAIAADLNARDLPGARFVPIRLKPRASVHVGEICGGINIQIVDRSVFLPVATGLAIAEALRDRHHAEWKAERMGELLANGSSLQAFLKGATSDTLLHSWMLDVEQFRERIKPVLLYA